MDDSLPAAGFRLIPSVFSARECDAITAEIEAALANCSDAAAALRSKSGALYGARNLLALWPGVEEIWRREVLLDYLRHSLGSAAGLVRVLYFDKPPEASWVLPWHRDMTIAVIDNSLPTTHFSRPTRKAGVPHVEAPGEILQQMLTLRIHLDPATPENGALQVIPGSHLNDDEAEPTSSAAKMIIAERGDVLAMRPLLSHASGASQAGTTQHRRILHLEFAALQTLPDGYRWHTFLPLDPVVA